jgi:hypothetical protein
VVREVQLGLVVAEFGVFAVVVVGDLLAGLDVLDRPDGQSS